MTRLARRNALTTEIAFDALQIEGGLLAADWLAKVAQLKAPFQSESDYRVPKGLNLRDEIGRYWRIAQAYWADLSPGRSSGVSSADLADQFVVGLLRDVFCFTSLTPTGAVIESERFFPVRFSALNSRVPVVIVPVGAGLDSPSSELGDGTRRRSPFGLLQEYLNAFTDATWGLACDALTLRLARDNASLTRPAWIEADLSRIFTEGLYPDFAALWLLIHESRFRTLDRAPEPCPLESWLVASREQGIAARERLSSGFEKAVVTLGQAFLSHAANGALRSALQSGQLTTEAYFAQLLRLLYRIIFLLTVEERDLLHVKGTPKSTRELYAAGYAILNVRNRSVRRSAHDHNIDQWEAVKIVFRGLAGGEPRLGLPALAGLFAPKQCPDLDAARLENRAFLTAVFQLCLLRGDSGIERVNWRDMGPDELGYIYEGLLELVPKITEDGRRFSFAGTEESRGHVRKLTGSYYTPDELVRVLLDTALEPVIERTVAAHPVASADALLELAVVDPTCGSGHFLIAAARRLAEHVARLRTTTTPTPEEYRRALRDVVRHCVYGVDANPLAVELCKVSLWMESVAPGLPLTFLETHVRYGNSLLGTTVSLMDDRIPDEAWASLEGDNDRITRLLRNRNRDESHGQGVLAWADLPGSENVREAMEVLEDSSDADLDALAKKEKQWESLLSSQTYEHERLVADAWCAAFLWPKSEQGEVVDAAPTNAIWRALRDRQRVSALLLETTRKISLEYGLFHWQQAFPRVFARGGFDVVLGNPPWEHLELKEQEFFALRNPVIANAPNADARKKLIAALPVTDPVLWEEWEKAKRRAQGEMHLARSSGRYPLCAVGRINTYALFAEHNWRVLNEHGRAGFLTPSGIVTDDTTKEFFQALTDQNFLSAVYHFENEDRLFRGLHHAYRFVLMTLGKAEHADFVFYARRALDLEDPERHFTLSARDLETLNPNTRNCATFRSNRDAKLNLALYRRVGILLREEDPDGNPWGISFLQGIFNMATDSGLFRTAAELRSAGWVLDGNQFVRDGKTMVPLCEAKMFSHFDHRFGTYAGQTEAQARQGKLPELDDKAHRDPHATVIPRYWVDKSEVEERLAERWDRSWLLGWRDITGTEKRRTVIPSVVPRSGMGNTFLLAMPSVAPRLVACLYANLSSMALDYTARQKVGGVHLTYNVFKQLPVFSPGAYAESTPWGEIPVADWLLQRVLELSYTAWDLRSFAQDCGDDGPPFLWDSERRFRLRCEIDAAFFHLYRIPREDVDFILNTFPVVRNSEERTLGEFRTKRVIIEIYDELMCSERTGDPYKSPLGPPMRIK
jgi:hypothetical protein